MDSVSMARPHTNHICLRRSYRANDELVEGEYRWLMGVSMAWMELFVLVSFYSELVKLFSLLISTFSCSHFCSEQVVVVVGPLA